MNNKKEIREDVWDIFTSEEILNYINNNPNKYVVVLDKEIYTLLSSFFSKTKAREYIELYKNEYISAKIYMAQVI